MISHLRDDGRLWQNLQLAIHPSGTQRSVILSSNINLRTMTFPTPILLSSHLSQDSPAEIITVAQQNYKKLSSISLGPLFYASLVSLPSYTKTPAKLIEPECTQASIASQPTVIFRYMNLRIYDHRLSMEL